MANGQSHQLMIGQFHPYPTEPPAHWFILLGLYETGSIIYSDYIDLDAEEYLKSYKTFLHNQLDNNQLSPIKLTGSNNTGL